MTKGKGKRLPPPADLDENPEWTDEMFARARPASEVHGPDRVVAMQRKRGRPAKKPSDRKQAVSIRLSPDVVVALRDTGEGWQTRVDELLRVALNVRLEGVRSPTDARVVDLVVAALHLGDPGLDLLIANDEPDNRPVMKRLLSAIAGTGRVESGEASETARGRKRV